MKYLKMAFNVLAVLIVLLALLLIASTLPIPGNYQVRIVETGSMEPTIMTGSIVVIKPVAQYQIGDIITFLDKSRSNKPVTHRINDMYLQEGNPIYITKGDANEDADANEVLPSHVIGKVWFHIPYLGRVLAAVKTPAGFMLVIVVPGIIIIYDEFRKVKAEIKKMVAKKKKKDDKQDQAIDQLEDKLEGLENKISQNNEIK